MARKKDLSADYRKWYASDEAKKFIIENIRKSGIPLELRARKAFKDHGFYVTSARYLEPIEGELGFPVGHGQGIWRELDVCASRSEKAFINIGKAEIHFATHILAECKYSTEKDLFVFEYLDKENADLNRFPLPVNGQCILQPFLARCFTLPLLVERVSEINAQSASKEKGNFSDTMTHDACEQILSALRFFLAKWRENVRRQYLNLARASAIKVNWDALLKAGKVPYETFGSISKVPDEFINRFLKESFEPEMLQDFPYFTVQILFPLLVTDESRGIIRVKLDGSYIVTSLDDVGSSLYLYVSENANRYESVLEDSFVLPILICNLSHLGAILEMITEGLSQVIEVTRQQLMANPYLIPKEIVFNDKVTGYLEGLLSQD